MTEYNKDSESFHRINRQPSQFDVIPHAPTREELQYELQLTRGNPQRRRKVLRLSHG